MGKNHSEAVSSSLWSIGCEQGDRNRRHRNGAEGIEAVTTVDFHKEAVAAGRPINGREAVSTFDTADGEVDQSELVGEVTRVGLSPDGSSRSILKGKANVQGCILQGVATRVAGYGLVCNPIVLLGLSGENRHQQNCGQKE